MTDQYLRQAIDIALQNVDEGGGPFGAVIIREGEVIASSGNRVTLSNDPTAHAEVLAIREAARKLGTWDLSGCVLYTSCEPCPMCFGAIYWAHIDKVYYACTHEDARDAGFDDSHIYHELQREPARRAITMQQSMRAEGLKVFIHWGENPDKKAY